MDTASGARRVIAACATVLLLGACAAAPVDHVVETLDRKTAVTVVALTEPLLYTSALGTPSSPDDVALGPFEINRMGQKSWYLWVSRLGGAQETPGLARLRIVADGETLLELEPLAGDVPLPMSAPPYAGLADWAQTAYFPVSAEDLVRLQGREGLEVELPAAADGAWVRFHAWSGRSAGTIDEFVGRQLSGRVAGR